MSTEETLEHLREAARERRTLQRRAVAAARATSDKEPFDIESFQAVHNVTWELHDEPLTATAIEDYERQYYLDSPGVKTLQQFAEHLAFLRDNDAT